MKELWDQTKSEMSGARCHLVRVLEHQQNIYKEASGTGSPCPADEEIRPCVSSRRRGLSSSSSLSGVGSGETEVIKDGLQHRELHIIDGISYCPKGYGDGCSVAGIVYPAFTPACNVHDICGSCNKHPNWVTRIET